MSTWGETKIKTAKNGGYFSSLGKEKARKWMLGIVSKSGSCLELGIGKDATFHNMVAKNAPHVKIKSLDDARNLNNKKELLEMAKKNPNLIIEPFYKWTKQGLETFSTVWLDYCGPWTNRIAEDIKMGTRVMQGKGVIAFTLLEAREHVHQLKLKPGATRNQIDKAIEKAIEKAFKEAGLKVKKIKEIKYDSAPNQKHVSPMRVVAYDYKKI